MPLGALGVIAALLGACDRAPIATCRDDLRGVYAAGDARWMVLDNGATLEAYPLFPDAADAGALPLEVAPRVIDLARRDGAIVGTLRRRYMRHAARCEATVPVHVTRCAGDTIELVLADPSPPIGFEPCTWPARPPTRLERWRRD